jgi:hypothetical protein
MSHYNGIPDQIGSDDKMGSVAPVINKILFNTTFAYIFTLTDVRSDALKAHLPRE